ncbi:MAG: hypothetical protein A3C84_04850 [Candidatus Ryanbacteria bacterium RIFCSPHIGHO2_02_FULL_48_12]|uniref:Uncharacterized protein n=1 Tax=Candidatus Ryanbacteria bacterium RIFCSPHIGHO2_01_FULL_48_27 TaxID=1802115 RepID=A0A1G2G5G6_9BACT|nr:MAG: hypothetical protein A2756_00525 [Candidatus Ryanbacteria bacterium RIFCSPHIGHO2_01_FULL_48_27]OGZ48402.1 MAG: hypothetical protein A3C84_04850 [Candidatus Ryanbacteria bacterium RIFCSPHIGHO2_02_FULL_48_12]
MIYLVPIYSLERECLSIAGELAVYTVKNEIEIKKENPEEHYTPASTGEQQHSDDACKYTRAGNGIGLQVGFCDEPSKIDRWAALEPYITPGALPPFDFFAL